MPPNPHFTYIGDVEGEGGSARQAAQSEVDVRVRAGDGHEVSHSKRARHLDKVH